MQRHTLTFRSKKRTKICVFFGFRIFCCFRMLSGSKKIAVFRNPPEYCHYCIGEVPLLQGKTVYIDVQNRHYSSAKVAPF